MERRSGTTSIRGVLFDRDGTLILNVPYNPDPELVAAMPGARLLLDELRQAGIKVGVVSNQSGIARGLLTADDVSAVNGRVDTLLGPFDVWKVCPHGPEDGCACRKPQPGMILDAAAELGLHPRELTIVGDIGTDIAAAQAAGSRGILVPTPETLEPEVAAAPEVAGGLEEILPLIMGERLCRGLGMPGDGWPGP